MSLQYQPNFYQIAEKFVGIGAYVVPAEPELKKCILDDWQNKATRDLGKVLEWSAQNPRYNVAIVGKPEIGAVWGFDDDSGILAEYETKHGPIGTYRTRTVSGGTHLLFKHNQASIDMGNLSAKNERNQELWSARTNNRYVISAGSVAHPHNDPEQPLTAYTAIDTTAPIEAPESFIAFIRSKAGESKPTVAPEQPEGAKVHEGGRNNYLASRLGKVHQTGVRMPELLTVGLQINEEHCVPPLPDSEVRTIAESIGKYPVKESGQIVFHSAPQPESEEVVIPKLNKVPYPVFPDWVMNGTSLYEGLVKPVCDVNSRIPHFMFLPAAAIMMNYLGNKIRVEQRNQIPSFFMVLIGEKGRAIKSSSVEDAIEYLNVAGFVHHAGSETRNAEGKSLVWTVGSPEGLGLEMTRTNCMNAILFYDELSGLTSKTEIDSSNLKSSLLTLYESGKFSNTIKSRKETFSLKPRTYCASLIACTTDENFEDNWSRLCGKSSGLDDRFIFLLQPQQLPELTPKIDVNTVAGAIETRNRINKAIQQQVYRFEDTTPLEAKIGVLGNRTEIRAEKWALYFAIDLGLDSITEGCVERGLAIANYEKAVKRYLGSPEAETRIAAAQIKYRRLLERKFDGRARTREMERAMNSNRYGTEGWYRIYEGLKKAGIIAEIGGGKPGVFKEVVVREPLEE
jgi:hypothetical protein